MAKERRMTFRLGLMTALVLVMAFLFYADGQGGMKGSESAPLVGPDMIRITADTSGETLEMPAALFFHDRHTAAMTTKTGCAECHPKKEDGRLVFSFKRLSDEDSDTGKMDKEAMMALYHDNCIGCHQERKDQGKPSGPMAPDCRACHANGNIESSWVEISFDKSLHYRHVSSKDIATTATEDTDNCSACHHEYDQQAKKLYYEKGKEGSCQYCHMETATDAAASFQRASHDACLNCHQALNAKKVKTGPVTCTGCHSREKQFEIAILDDVPRMKRNQPNATILATSAMTALKNGKQKITDVLPVTFNHKQHEMGVASCRNCHHASMESCTTCHTASGTEKGQFVRLEQAMHSRQSVHSCMGCHEVQKNSQHCAGCHEQMPAKTFTNADCSACHNTGLDRLEIEKGGDSLLMNQKMRRTMAEALVSQRNGPVAAIPNEDIPESVTISSMVDQYEAATFPHRKIVDRLRQRINDSALGRYYHKDAGTLCAGCHHNSASLKRPPKCATCHGDPFKEAGRPGLKGAYHLQCIGCHQQMKLEKPAATDCTACHVKINTKANQSVTTP